MINRTDKIKADTKQDMEKQIFQFTSLGVWQDLLGVTEMMEETALNAQVKNDDTRYEMKMVMIKELAVNAEKTLENLVIGYEKYHLDEKYEYYGNAKTLAVKNMLLVYRLGFSGVIDKEKVLEMGMKLREVLNGINGLIRKIENWSNRRTVRGVEKKDGRF